MSNDQKPQLSQSGVEELLKVASRPPVDTPARRATFERARAAASFVRSEMDQARSVRRSK